MKKIILVGAIALLAACGSTKNDVSVGTGAGNSTTGSSPAAGDATGNSSGDTITVDNFGDMPPKCIELLGGFLKKIEPTVSKPAADRPREARSKSSFSGAETLAL